MKRSKWMSGILFVYIAVAVLMAVLPFLIVVVISFTDEITLGNNGFALIPEKWSIEAYATLFRSPGQMLTSAAFTLFLSFTVPLLSCIFNALAAYPLARPDFRYKKLINRYLIYTMLIGAGMLPSYIVNTRYYGLYDSPLIYFIGLTSAWSIFMYRTFFKEVPNELVEAAKLDGANEFQILWRVMLPTVLPVFAMQYTLGFIGQWNSADTALYYISNPDYYQLQYYLNLILSDLEFLKQSMSDFGLVTNFPTETIKYAMLVISLLPIFALFPYMQKFFAKGMVSGSVKG